MQKATKNMVEKKARADQREKYNLKEEEIDSFPETACLECFRLPREHHCRQKIHVSEQEVKFLKGCGITMAPEGERMKPGAVCEVI
jgi:Pyruvate/2-oxoacid:ferredoxin oxidoreductase delta subunit